MSPFICFNPACGEQGNLPQLVQRLAHKNKFEAARLIQKKGTEAEPNYQDQLAKQFLENDDLPEFPQAVIDRMRRDFWTREDAMAYMHGRGFEDDTLNHFEIGWSAANIYRDFDAVVVPVHSVKGVPVGVVGRSLVGKEFKNSADLPRSQTMFNIHRAKRIGETVIVVESSFDAMRLWQVGYPNAVAVLGGNMSKINYYNLDRHFNRIVLMTDFDQLLRYDKCKRCMKIHNKPCQGHNPGRELGRSIAANMRNKLVYWASYEHGMVYPHGAKDPGDLTEQEIKQCLANMVPDAEYRTWKIDGQP